MPKGKNCFEKYFQNIEAIITQLTQLNMRIYTKTIKLLSLKIEF